MLIVAGFMMPWFLWPEDSSPTDRATAMVERLSAEGDSNWFIDYFGMTRPQLGAATNLIGISVSGYNLPLVFTREAGAPKAQRLRQAKVLGEYRQQDRAWFAYAVPLLAVLAATFVAFVPQRWALFLPLLGCAFLYTAMRYMLAVGYYDRVAAAVEIGPGLWLSLYALLALWAVILARIFLPEDSPI